MSSLLQQAYNPEFFRTEGHRLIDTLANYLAEAQSGHQAQAMPYQEPENALAFWQNDFKKPLMDSPQGLFEEIISRSVHLHNPRYMGHQVSASLPLSVLSGLLTGMLNNGMALYEMGMVSSPIEKIVSDFLAQKIGFDHGTGFLTSGGTLANLTALLTARAVKAPNEVWQEGHTQKLALMVSEEAHYCVERAARIMGWGMEGIIKIPTNERFQMQTDLLEKYYTEAAQQGVQVIAVVGSACSTSTGSYDDLEAISSFCEQHNLWFHVDGAHGGGVTFSEKYKHLIRGIERADSVIIDWHKMLMMPALATAVLYRKAEESYQTFQQKAQYLWENAASEDWFNMGKRTFECTKVMYAVKIYTALRVHGEAIFSENVETLYDLGQRFAQMITQDSRFELATAPQSNIVCFRIKTDNEADSNSTNTLLRKKVLEEGRFYIVQTSLRGQTYLRVSLMNPLTTEKELEELMEALV